jgi:hypothetical protein
MGGHPHCGPNQQHTGGNDDPFAKVKFGILSFYGLYDAVHHGRANKYTLMHKGEKITLLPLMQIEIVHCDRAIADTAKCESEIQHDQRALSLSSNAIKLKSHAMLATWSDLFIPTTVDAPYHALVCR